ncbi:hypothetical protein GCM10011369_25990 [Neiella marina]|uniref:Beta-xylanase n=1 Tax=Neiella marina TaxID=508461 RepID=A0A8J2U713_9GAMM|nr:endo-1,4-beta-xylanase [Neiella marina]GGA82800.1 hypothetical protein GCM10011369_25990 [Neiella marina]
MFVRASHLVLMLSALLISACGVDGKVSKSEPQEEVPETPVEPTDPEPTDPEPTDPEPTDPEPTDPEPTDPEPTDPEPTDPEPTDPEPTDPEPTDPEPADPLMVNGDFENGEVAPWVGNSGEVLLTNVASQSRSGANSLLVSGRTQNWQGALYGLTNSVAEDSTYHISAWVRMDNLASSDVRMTVKVSDGNGDRYEPLAQASATDSGWVELAGNYTIATSGDVAEIAFYIEGPDAGVSYFIDDVTVTDINDDDLLRVDVDHLSALAEFPIGVAVPAGDAGNSMLNSPERQAIVEQHFSQLTAENIMKPSYLQPSEGNFFFDDADALIAYAENNGLSVHGHALIWHFQIADWMANYSGDASAWQQMLETHVTEVASHFEGQLASWDVVNEAFLDDGSYRNVDVGNDAGSVWYQNIGPQYIEYAFNAARAADAHVDLYYNDYNISWNDTKLNAILTMAEDFIDRGIPISGIGFQMHVDKSGPGKAKIKEQFQKVVDLGLKVKITEVDLRMNADGSATSLTNQLLLQQKARYQEIVEAYIETVPPSLRGGISVWGIADPDTWIVPLYGNPDWPLMFDDQFEPKPALQGFADGLAATDAEEPEQPSDPAPTDPEPSDPQPLFVDDFNAATSWANEGADGQLAATLSHNSAEGTMVVDVPWASDADVVHIKTWFGQELDLSAGNDISLRVKLPADYVADGNLVVQVYIEDSAYTPAFTGWQMASGFVAGDWTTITLSGVGPDFSFGYDGGVDFTKVHAIGIELVANGKDPAISGAIEIDDVTIH